MYFTLLRVHDPVIYVGFTDVLLPCSEFMTTTYIDFTDVLSPCSKLRSMKDKLMVTGLLNGAVTQPVTSLVSVYN